MQYFSQIKAIRETEEGTDLILHIPGEKMRDKIEKYRNNNIINAQIRIDDNRTITANQQRKIFATIKDIAKFTGDLPEELRAWLLYDYCIQSGELPFSLKNCSISTAREYITFIIDFILKENIPLSDAALTRTDDIDKYLYGCIKYRRCAITGEAGAEIHHVTGSRVGMGRNRVTINHSGLEIMALSRKWHDKVHNEGEGDIFSLYKIYGIKVDAATLNSLGIKAEDID